MVIALLAGGTGGAKLAVGLRDLLFEADHDRSEHRLRVIANTGDDIEIYGVHVSPDPDLITFRLAGVLGPLGFGIVGESHHEMDALRAAGEDVWFELGDDDMVVCRARSAALAAGSTLTEAHRASIAAYDTAGAEVLPMSDQPVRTEIETSIGRRGLQEFLIRDRSEPEISSVEFVGIDAAQPTAESLTAVKEADAIIIGPSNPVISIGPILALNSLRAAIVESAAPVIAVSPFVGGEILKGPTEKFLAAAGVTADNAGLAEYYGDLVDAYVADEPIPGYPTHAVDVRMADAANQRRVAQAVVAFAQTLPSARGTARLPAK